MVWAGKHTFNEFGVAVMSDQHVLGLELPMVRTQADRRIDDLGQAKVGTGNGKHIRLAFLLVLGRRGEIDARLINDCLARASAAPYILEA